MLADVATGSEPPWHLAVAGPREPERLLDGRQIAPERSDYRANLWTLDLGTDPAPGY